MLSKKGRCFQHLDKMVKDTEIRRQVVNNKETLVQERHSQSEMEMLRTLTEVTEKWLSAAAEAADLQSELQSEYTSAVQKSLKATWCMNKTHHDQFYTSNGGCGNKHSTVEHHDYRNNMQISVLQQLVTL